ncbi:MAG: type II toxin-antitoxin system VapC family toxin [Acidobacteriota bacterium]
MNVLLDTCALLALTRGKLPDRAMRALRAAPEASVSVVSAWEVAIKVAGGKLRLTLSPREWFHGVIERYALRDVLLDAQTACAAAALPRLHHDPFDRVIVALAQAQALTVLTSDENIARYPSMRTIW